MAVSSVSFPFLDLFFNIGDFIMILIEMQLFRHAFAIVPSGWSHWEA